MMVHHRHRPKSGFRPAAHAAATVLPTNLTPSLAGVKNTLDLLRQQGIPGLAQDTPQQFVDSSYVS